jgi:hypothetical protein
MGWDQREEYAEAGTGQVFYLYQDDSGQWVNAMFSGGPAGARAIGSWPTRDQAVAEFGSMSCPPVQ